MPTKSGTDHYNQAERLLRNPSPDALCFLGAIAHALLALVRAEEENSDEIVTMAASLAHLADDMASQDDDDEQAHVGGLVP